MHIPLYKKICANSTTTKNPFYTIYSNDYSNFTKQLHYFSQNFIISLQIFIYIQNKLQALLYIQPLIISFCKIRIQRKSNTRNIAEDKTKN